MLDHIPSIARAKRRDQIWTNAIAHTTGEHRT